MGLDECSSGKLPEYNENEGTVLFLSIQLTGMHTLSGGNWNVLFQ